MFTLINHAKEFRAGGTLVPKALRGGAWLGVGSIAEQVLRFARNMLLTRLLAPEVFGLMAIVLAISSAAETLTEIGVREAIIQNPRGQEDHYVNSAWWLAFLRAVGLYLLVFAS